MGMEGDGHSRGEGLGEERCEQIGVGREMERGGHEQRTMDRTNERQFSCISNDPRASLYNRKQGGIH